MENEKILEVSVKAVFISDGAVMFLRTSDGKIRDLPGGHVEFGETTIGALKRELKEELDFEYFAEPFLAHVWTYFSRDGKAHRINIVYGIDVGGGCPQFIYRERDDVELVWLPEEKIKSMNFLSGMEESLFKALALKERMSL